MTKKQKKMVARLVGSAVFFIVAMMLEKKTFWAWIPFVLSYLAAGYDIPVSYTHLREVGSNTGLLQDVGWKISPETEDKQDCGNEHRRHECLGCC